MFANVTRIVTAYTRQVWQD